MFSSSGIYMAVGLLPAVLLLFYIYKMDRIEKEPKGLLVGLFFLGVGATIPTIIVELLLSVVNNGIFFGQLTTGYEYTIINGKTYLYEFINNFFGIALVEEGFKWLFMFLLTRKSKSFNCLFDGVVYAAFVSLGFAAAENVFYVFSGGLVTGVMRILTAVPAHCAFSVVMGYFYGKWFVCRNSGALEKNLYQNRVITTAPSGFSAGKFLILSIVIPVAIHGFYDFCCTFTAISWVYWLLLFLLLIFLYIICFRNVYVLSKKDAYITYLCMEKVLERYPDSASYLCRMPEHVVFFTPEVIQLSIINRETHGVKVTTNNLYYAHPLPVVKPRPVPQPVYPQTQYGQPVVFQPQAQPVQYARPVNQPQAQPAQYARPVNQPQAQPVQYARPGNQPQAQPVQYARPVNQPQAQPVQYARPVNQPQAQPVQYTRPVNQSQAQPVQYARPVNQPQEQPVQYARPVNQPQTQPVQYARPANQPQAQPVQYAQPDYSNGGRPVAGEEPYTRQLDNLEPVGGYRRYGGTPTVQFSDQSQNPYTTQR